MATLRVYLAIAASIDRDARSAPLSWDLLEELTGLSRPMVSKGLSRAQDLGLLSADTTRRPHVYTLLDDGTLEPGDLVLFCKVPKHLVLKELRALPTRGVAVLEALKLYVTLLTVRDRYQYVARIGHEKIVWWTGMQPRHVKRAVSMLVAHNFIHVTQAESEGTGHPFNEYQLLGFQTKGHDEAVATRSAAPQLPATLESAPNVDVPF